MKYSDGKKPQSNAMQVDKDKVRDINKLTMTISKITNILIKVQCILHLFV